MALKKAFTIAIWEGISIFFSHKSNTKRHKMPNVKAFCQDWLNAFKWPKASSHTLTCSTFKAPGSVNNGSWKNLHWILADSPQRCTQLCCQDANWARRKPKQDSSAYGSFQSTVTIPTGSDAPQLVGRGLSVLLTAPVNNLATCPL